MNRESSLKIVFLGDVILRHIRLGEDPFLGISTIFDHCDYVVANLETVIIDGKKNMMYKQKV